MWIFWVAVSWGDTETRLRTWIQEIWHRHPSIEANKSRIEERISSMQSIEQWKEPYVSLSVAPLGLGYSVVLRQPYLYPQEYRLQKERASLQLEESKRRLNESKEMLQKEFLTHLVDWMYAQKKFELSMQHRSLIMAHKKSVQGRIEVGAIPKAVLAQLESELADLELLQIGYQSSIRVHQLRLEELLGRSWKENLSLHPPPSLPQTRGKASFLLQPKIAQKDAQILGKLHETNKRPPLFFSMGHSNMMMEQDKWWTMGFGLEIPINQRQKQARIQESLWQEKRHKWEEKALLDTWKSKVEAEEELVRGLLAQRDIIQNKTHPTVERECSTMGVAFEAGQVSIDALLRAEHKRVRILDHDAQLVKHLWYSYAKLLYWYGITLEDL